MNRPKDGFSRRPSLYGDSPTRSVCTLTGIAFTLLVAVALLAVMCSGCTPGASYVGADAGTYRALAGEYVEYVDGDTTRDDGWKESRRRLVRSWRGRLLQGGTAPEDLPEFGGSE